MTPIRGENSEKGSTVFCIKSQKFVRTIFVYGPGCNFGLEITIKIKYHMLFYSFLLKIFFSLEVTYGIVVLKSFL